MRPCPRLLIVVAAWVGCVHAQDGADGDKKSAKKKGPASKKVAGKDQSFFRLVVTGACRGNLSACERGVVEGEDESKCAQSLANLEKQATTLNARRASPARVTCRREKKATTLNVGEPRRAVM